ncbi:MAG: hypothetical protein HXY30_20195 [Pseudorhodoplanes sp.]|nr:hypothetical protein [Pseudorhodoplanes sp.]
MTPSAFRASISSDAPPPQLSPALEALWWSGKGDWDRAHGIVMAHEDDREASWVHAHLHRVEGDLPNARYWYANAGQPVCETSLDDEWETIAHTLLVDKTSG